MKLQELVDAVKAHALANYESEGWDFCVECWSDNDIAEMIAEDETVEAAIANVGRTCSLLGERRSEVQAEAY